MDILTLDSQGRQYLSLPAGQKCVILNSRQSKRPCNRDSWVTATVAAVEEILARGLTVITSTGLNTWEVVVHLVNVSGGRQIIVLSPRDRNSALEIVSQTISDFKLDPSRCLFIVPILSTSAGKREKDTWSDRDRLATELADLILPVSIRPEGNLDRLISEMAAAGKEVRNHFRVAYSRPADRIQYDFDRRELNPALDDPSRQYVVHWTRSSHDPCPGESHYDYYRDIISSTTYPRSAFHVLSRMASEQMIRSSTRFIRGGFQVISFSELLPRDAVKLMRWRRRYVYYSFEPYGIAIRKDVALATGMRPVIYGDDTLYAQLDENDRPFFQSRGSEVSDWRPEAEWRHLGNLDLRGLPTEGIELVTYSVQEAEILQRETKFKAVPLALS